MTLPAYVLSDLKRSGLDAADAERMRVRALTAAETKALTNRFAVLAAQYPYADRDGRPTDFYRIRFAEPVPAFGGKKPLRYWNPTGSTPHPYLLQGVPWPKVFMNTSTMLLVTEGEKKAAAACKVDLLCIGLGGVWNFQSKKLEMEFLPELEAICWTGRLVETAYDGDAALNENVSAARVQLGRRLVERGAKVVNVILPIGKSLDDVLRDDGPDGYKKLPRVAVDAKVQISLVRARPKTSSREKKEAIADIALKDVLGRGSMHMADDEPLIFDRDERRLMTLFDGQDAGLRAYFEDRYAINGSEAEWTFLFERLRGHAIRHGTPTQTPLFSHYDSARATLLLFCGAHNVFKVTPDGVELVSNGYGDVLFRGFDIEPVTPAKRPSEAAFRAVLGIPNFAGGQRLTRDQQTQVYELHFWSLLFPTLMRTRPLLLLHAVKGSGKTTGGRAIGKALFGQRFDVQMVNPDRLQDEVVPALIHSPLVVLDNLDGRLPGLEDLLAVAATGAKITRRILYTTMGKAEFPLRARVIATSRQPDAFARDDVRDRTIVLGLERRETFRAEQDIVDQTLAQRPAFWAYVLARLPSVIKALAGHRPAQLTHRLADFAQFCVAIGPALGYPVKDVLAGLDAVDGERNSFAADTSNVLRALQFWAELQQATHKANQYAKSKAEQRPFNFQCVRQRPTDVFMAVKDAWPEKMGRFPFNKVETFGYALKNEEPMLRSYFRITREMGRSNSRLITIEQVRDRDEKR